jgi:hypothetical protein
VTTPLDSILSRGGEALPSGDTTTEMQQVPATEAETQTTPDTEHTDTDAQGAGEQNGKPPFGAIRHAEREKVAKRYTEQVAEFQRSADEARREAAETKRMLAQFLEQQQTARQQQEPEPDVFDDPKRFVSHEVAPLKTELAQQREYWSRRDAIREHGEQTVSAAFSALHEAAMSGDPEAVEAVRHVRTRSVDPFGDIVQWHRKQERLSPDYDERLKQKHEAEFREKYGLGDEAAPQRQQQAPALNLPSNFAAARNVGVRNGPTWSGPTTIADIFNRKRGTG